MKREEADWVVVYMTNRREKAEKAAQTLEAENFLARIYPQGSESASGAFEVKCLMSEALEARNILTEKGIV